MIRIIIAAIVAFPLGVVLGGVLAGNKLCDLIAELDRLKSYAADLELDNAKLRKNLAAALHLYL